LIDIAERNNPRTHVVWELAKQRAENLGVAKSAYYPVLAGLAVFSDQRVYEPAEDQLANGRSTLPDVLNARAETSQAVFDMESADGDEKIARVSLTETIGVEPSPDIIIDAQKNAPA